MRTNTILRVYHTLIAVVIFVAFVLTGTVVYAYLYRAPLSISENMSNNYTMLPVMSPLNTTWLVNNGFMNVTANDTRVQTLGGLNKPWLVTDNRTLTAVPVQANTQTNLYFVTGESAASSMDIITGYGGYVTIPSGVGDSMQLGDNFTVEMSGYIDTSIINNSILYKPSAYRVFVDGATDISAVIYDAVDSNIIEDAVTINWYVIDNAADYVAQTFTTPTGGVSQQHIALPVDKGTATGTLHIALRETSGGLPIGSDLVATTATIETFPLGSSWQQFILNYALGSNITYAVVVYSTDITGSLIVLNDNTNSYAGGTVCVGTDGVTWVSVPADDLNFRVNGKGADAMVTATGIVSGDIVLQTYADGTNLKIDIDGVTEDSVALGGASVTDNANDWVLYSDASPYLDYLSFESTGVDTAYYAPNAIITGTNLPDRITGAYDGVITWGSNPAGVNVSLGSMVSSGQSAVGAISDTSTNDILPIAGGSDWRPEAAVSTQLQSNPLRPIVLAVSDNTTLSEYQVWIWIGIIFVIFITVLTGSRVRGHHTITGIAASAAIVFMVVLTIFPLWALFVVALAIWGGHISERSPSL